MFIRAILQVFVLFLLALTFGADVTTSSSAYINDFELLDEGAAPEDFLVLAGDFKVREISGNKALELPGEPLEHFVALFGPVEHTEVTVSARIWGDVTGKRYPEFGIGAADAFGYRLRLVPVQNLLQLLKGDEVVAAVAYERWKPQSWTDFHLTVRKGQGESWNIEGKVGPHDQPNAPRTRIRFEDQEDPPAGRGSIWGTPFSGKPIRFDDLTMTMGPLPREDQK